MKKIIIGIIVIVFFILYSYCSEKKRSVPALNVKGKWHKTLTSKFLLFDNMKVLSTYRNDGRKDKVLFDSKVNENELKGLLLSIQVEENGSGFHCMCDGDYHFKFYKQDQLVVTLGYHHGRSLRWHDGQWKGDALLTARSQEALIKWFFNKGFKDLQQDQDKRVAEIKQIEKEDAMFTSYFPKSVYTILKAKGGSAFDREAREKSGPNKIAASFNSKKELGLACCKAMGSTSMHSWTSTSGKERIVLAAGNMLNGDEFLTVLESFADKKEPKALRGAARFFFREGFDQKLPEKHAIKWAVELARVELQTNYDDNKNSVIRSLSKYKSPEINKLLGEIAHQKIGKIAKPEKVYGEEPILYVSAYLSLAKLGDQSIKKEIEAELVKIKSPHNKAALEVCLVLLGDPRYIRGSHFKFRSYSIGLSAIRGIENFKGKHGLETLIEYGLDHPWAGVSNNAVLAIQRITTQNWTKGGRGQPRNHKKTIKKWWSLNKAGVLNKLQRTGQ